VSVVASLKYLTSPVWGWISDSNMGGKLIKALRLPQGLPIWRGLFTTCVCNTWLRTVVLSMYYHKKEKVREITM